MDNAQGRDLAPSFGDLSQIEKLSEIKLPLIVLLGVVSSTSMSWFSIVFGFRLAFSTTLSMTSLLLVVSVVSLVELKVAKSQKVFHFDSNLQKTVQNHSP